MSPMLTGFIALAVLLNIVACLWLIWWTSRRRPGEEAEGAEKSHVWDGDLRELNNPMPRWWLNLFILSIVFALAYLVLYPGLGAYQGTFGWSQASQHDARLAVVNDRRRAHYGQFAGREIVDLAQDLKAAQAGARLFADHCAGCHGPTARGAVGFPDLSDQDWLYGGDPEQIYSSIANGRRGVMPPFMAALDEASARDLVALVANWQQPALPADRADRARAKFGTVCAACHGAQGRGNPQLGAPDLTDDIWLHGGTPEQIRQTILFGRGGQMPAHAQLLEESELRLLAAYVYRVAGASSAH